MASGWLSVSLSRRQLVDTEVVVSRVVQLRPQTQAVVQHRSLDPGLPNGTNQTIQMLAHGTHHGTCEEESFPFLHNLLPASFPMTTTYSLSTCRLTLRIGQTNRKKLTGFFPTSYPETQLVLQSQSKMSLSGMIQPSFCTATHDMQLQGPPRKKFVLRDCSQE